METQKKMIVISGPTATGKTKIGIELAKKINGEVVNFDSLLFYKEISIGTAKPTIEEMDNIKHHLVSITSIASPINAAQFLNMAIPVIKEIFSRGKIPILSGGSGFYLQTILKGMYDSPTTPIEIVKKSDQLFSQSGIEPFIAILKNHDPYNYEKLHQNDIYRIRRAVEHFWHTGNAFSSQIQKLKDKTHVAPVTQNNWDFLHVYLDIEKDQHGEIIKQRTSKIFKQGIIEEVKDLLTQNFSGLEKPLQSIGYKQVISFLNGEFKSIDETIERTIIATRQLAKSQRTWFNKVEKTKYNPILDFNKIHHDVTQFIG